MIISVSALIDCSFSINSHMGFQVTPGGQNRNAGKEASSIAIGPCSRSAEENRSATT